MGYTFQTVKTLGLSIHCNLKSFFKDIKNINMPDFKKALCQTFSVLKPPQLQEVPMTGCHIGCYVQDKHVR